MKPIAQKSRTISRLIGSFTAFAIVLASSPFAYGAMPEGAKIYYYLHDHLGGIHKVLDEEGNVVCENDYLPYGEERMGDCTEEANEDYGFTGKEKDEETGLNYYGARYYDGGIGRFTSADPLLYNLNLMNKSQQIEFLKNPQYLNIYSYTTNNPIRYNDPTGLFNAESGAIEKDDTPEKITEGINQKWGTSYSWSEISNLNSGVLEAGKSLADLVGKALIPNSTIKDVTNKLWVEMVKWGGVAENVDGISNKLNFLKVASLDPNKLDLKNRANSIFNTVENNGQDYVFSAERIRYDAPGNILYGYVGKALGIGNTLLFMGAGSNQTNSLNTIKIFMQNIFRAENDLTFGDDPIDNLNIKKGINLYE